MNLRLLCAVCACLFTISMTNSSDAALFPVAVSFTENSFQDDFGLQVPPTDTVSGSFSFVLDDSGLTELGAESRTFNPIAVNHCVFHTNHPFIIDGTEYNVVNTGIEVIIYDGIVGEIDFGGLVGGIGIFPQVGANDFALMLLGNPPIQNFHFEQMRYSSENYPTAEYFVTTTGVAEVSIIPLPSAIYLLGSGLLGLVGMARRKKI